MRRAANIDRSQQPIVKALRDIGASVQILSHVGQGVPDLLVGYRNINVLLEVKNEDDGPKKRALTAAEKDWHAMWGGQVAIAHSPEEAQMVVIEHCKATGKL